MESESLGHLLGCKKTIIVCLLTMLYIIPSTEIMYSSAMAAEGNSQRFDLNIKARDLGTAMADFIEQTDVQLLYPYNLAQTTGLNPVIGSYTLREALDIMFRNTDFSAGLTDRGTVTVSYLPDTEHIQKEKNVKKNITKASLLASVSALLFGTGGAPALAQDGAQDDEIVVQGRVFRNPAEATATKLRTPIAETPGSITVLNEQIIDDLAADDFADALQYITGVGFSPFGNELNLGARGFGTSQRNALRVNGSPLGEDYRFDNVAVDRVEYVKGASAVTYGQITPAGFLNVGLKEAPTELEISGQIRIGDNNFTRGEVSVGGALTESGNIRGLIGYSQESSTQYFDFGDANSDAFFATVSVDLLENFSLTGTYTNNNRKDVQNTGLPLGQDNTDPENPILRLIEVDNEFYAGIPSNRNTSEFDFVQFKAEYNFSDAINFSAIYSHTNGDKRSFTAEAGGFFLNDSNPYVYQDFQYVDLTPTSPTYGDVNYDVFIGGALAETDYIELRFFGASDLTDNVSIDYLISAERFDFERGFERYTNIGDVGRFNIFNPDRSVGNPFANAENLGVGFTQGDEVDSVSGFLSVDLYERLRISGGVRYDERVASDEPTGGIKEEFPVDATSYTATAVYDLTDNVHAYYSYGDVVEFLTNVTCDGSALPAVDGTMHEIGVKYEPNSNLLLTAAVYDSEVQGGLDSIQCPPGSLQTVATIFNGEAESSQGIELEVLGNITPQWNIIAGYAYNDSKTDDDNLDISDHSFSMFTIYDFEESILQNVGLGLGVRYETDRVVSSRSPQRDAGSGFPLDDLFRVDLAAYYDLNDNVDFALNVRNIFDDETYISPFDSSEFNITPLEGRTIIGTMNFRF